MPPNNPKIGDCWTNDTGYTFGAVNPREVAVWNGVLWMPVMAQASEREIDRLRKALAQKYAS